MGKLKILLVDDEPALTRILKMNLEATGRFEVMVENKGSQALKTAKAFGPDLVFLDIVMPDIEGSEVARQLKADEKLKSVPIVFLTATVTPDEIRTYGNVIGGNPFLAKPATLEQVLQCIERFVKG
jgi:DNA-binding response OmpR family regulator